SRFEKGVMPMQPRTFDIRKIAHEAIEIVEAPSRVRITESIAAGTSALADPSIVRRVISNLVSNACKFSGDQGVDVLLESQGECIRIAVKDSGPGIAPEFHESIFEKFVQVDDKDAAAGRSTGLGLNFCKLAVNACAGDIGVDSDVG